MNMMWCNLIKFFCSTCTIFLNVIMMHTFGAEGITFLIIVNQSWFQKWSDSVHTIKLKQLNTLYTVIFCLYFSFTTAAKDFFFVILLKILPEWGNENEHRIPMPYCCKRRTINPNQLWTLSNDHFLSIYPA